MCLGEPVAHPNSDTEDSGTTGAALSHELWGDRNLSSKMIN